MNIVDRNKLTFAWIERNLRPKCFVISDANYFLPSESLIKEDIYPKFKLWLETLDLYKWKYDWDCDNFADAFKLFACGYYANTIECEAQGIAVGVVNFTGIRPEDGVKGGHAANIIYLEDEAEPTKLKIKFLEPQNGQIYTPSEELINSVWTVYI